MVSRLGFIACDGKRLVHQGRQTPAFQRLAVLVRGHFAKKRPHLLVMAADDPVQAKIQSVRFVQLEQLGHQFDKTGFGWVFCGHRAFLIYFSADRKGTLCVPYQILGGTHSVPYMDTVLWGFSPIPLPVLAIPIFTTLLTYFVFLAVANYPI